MKKIFYLFILISGFTFGQFTIKDSSDNWEKIGNAYAHTILYQRTDKSKAKIEYRDFQPILQGASMDYSYYIFEFSTDASTIDKLYQIIKEHFESKKEEVIVLEFPEGNMILEFGKALGSYYFQFQFEKVNDLLDKGDKAKRVTGSFGMKQVNKLFNRK